MTEKETHVYGCQCNDCCSNHFMPALPLEAGGFNYTDVNSPCYKNHQLVMERLDKIEGILDFTKNLLNAKIHIDEKQGKRKIPHKCPVCDGKGKIQTYSEIMEAFEKREIDGLGRHFKECTSCEGKGIVWG